MVGSLVSTLRNERRSHASVRVSAGQACVQVLLLCQQNRDVCCRHPLADLDIGGVTDAPVHSQTVGAVNSLRSRTVGESRPPGAQLAAASPPISPGVSIRREMCQEMVPGLCGPPSFRGMRCVTLPPAPICEVASIWRKIRHRNRRGSDMKEAGCVLLLCMATKIRACKRMNWCTQAHLLNVADLPIAEICQCLKATT